MNRSIPVARFLVVTILVALAFVAPSRALAARFPDPVPTINSAFLLGAPTVNGSPLQAGDEIAAYSVHPRPGAPGKWEKTLIGHAVIDASGQVANVPAYGDDNTTTGIVEGAVPGEEICLVLWRASEGKEYGAYTGPTGLPTAVVWTSDGSTVPVDVDFVEGGRIPLRTGGWNLTSYGVMKGYQALNRAVPVAPQLPGLAWDNVPTLGDSFPLRSIAGKYDRILGNDGTGSTFWNPVLPTISSLAYLAPGYGYWVKTKPSTLPLAWMTVPGAPAAGSEPLSMNVGWTLTGYWDPRHVYHATGYDVSGELLPVDGSDNVALPSMADLWMPLGGNYIRVISFDGTGSKLWNPSLPAISTLKYMGPGYGYWVKLSAAGNLVFPASLADPAVPKGVAATAGDSQVTVNWSPVAGATSYNLYWSTSPGVSKATGTKISGVVSPYPHTGLTNGTMYFYVVTAVIGGVESSESMQVQTSPVVPPPTITGFVPTSAIPGATVTITGTNFVPSIAGNTVRFNGVIASVTSATSTRLTATVPPTATTGPISVETTSGTATSSGVFTVQVPPTVTTEMATGVSLSGATLNGTVNPNGSITTTTAWFEWGQDPDFGTYSVTQNLFVGDGTTARPVSITVSGFVPGATYYFRCVATNFAGTRRGEILAFTPVLAAPTGLTAIPVNSGNITLEWAASHDNVLVAGYRVYREGAPVGTTTTTAYYDNGLAAATPYHYRVKAFDSTGTESPFSDEATATTFAAGGGTLRVRVLDGLRQPHAGGDNVFVVLGASDGSFVASGIPDGNGEVYFSSPPPGATVTLAQILPGSYPGGPPYYSLDSVFEVNVPAITVFTGSDGRYLGTASLNISYSVNGVVRWKLFGDYNPATNASPLVVNVRPQDVQSDGKVSFLVVGYDNTGNAIGYGTALDATFSNGMSANVSINRTDFTTVSYLIQNVPAAARRMRISMSMTRKGVTSYYMDNTLNPPLPTVAAMGKVPSVYWDIFEYDLEFSYDQDGNGIVDSYSGFQKSSSTLENQSFDASQALPLVPLPTNLALSGVGIARPAISWDWSGASSTVDQVGGGVSFNTPDNHNQVFNFTAPPTRRSITVPQLPDSLSVLAPAGSARVNYLQYYDSDLIAGWDEYWNLAEQYFAGTFSFPPLARDRSSNGYMP